MSSRVCAVLQSVPETVAQMRQVTSSVCQPAQKRLQFKQDAKLMFRTPCGIQCSLIDFCIYCLTSNNNVQVCFSADIRTQKFRLVMQKHCHICSVLLVKCMDKNLLINNLHGTHMTRV